VHDFGATWTQTKVVDSDRYYFAFDADVLPDGTVVFAETASRTPALAARRRRVVYVVFTSPTRASWNSRRRHGRRRRACVSAGCGPDFIGHGPSRRRQRTSDLHLRRAATEGGPQRIYVRTSADEGTTWSARTALSVAGESATTPAIEQVGSGDARAWYMQTGNHDAPGTWNVWYRSSTNGGQTWSSPVRLSDATSGAGYKHPAGFDEVYGDYGEICITDSGKAIAIWGEGFS
jgi:hypothetical protein